MLTRLVTLLSLALVTSPAQAQRARCGTPRTRAGDRWHRWCARALRLLDQLTAAPVRAHVLLRHPRGLPRDPAQLGVGLPQPRHDPRPNRRFERGLPGHPRLARRTRDERHDPLPLGEHRSRREPHDRHHLHDEQQLVQRLGQLLDSLAWDTNRYLNIYTNSPPCCYGYVSGFASQGNLVGQTRDRVVCWWEAVGRAPTSGWPGNRGRTATHEVGHYLGPLPHVLRRLRHELLLHNRRPDLRHEPPIH